MKFAILIFNDLASQNVLKYLTNLPSNAFIYHVKNSGPHACICCEDIDKTPELKDVDILLFVTTHSSKSGIKSLSLHTQGNWGKAEFGGKDKELAPCPALYLKEGFKKMVEICDLTDFEVIQECTHHDPYVEKPSIFIEIGSSENEWGLEKAGEINSEVIKHLVSVKPELYRTAIGVGGIHHTPNFKKIQLGLEIAVGHVCPKYMLEDLDKCMILQALKKTEPESNLIIVDWKGLGEYKQKIKFILDEIYEETGLEIKKTKDY